jgi:hypothetical protein
MPQYLKKNWDLIHRKNVMYVKRRYVCDPLYKLKMQMRNRLNNAIRRHQKAGSAVRDLGCTVTKLKKYLEAQFQPGMTWENHTVYGWHIHHKRALETFDLTDPVQFKQAVHYTNLQPMWRDQHQTLHAAC